MNRDLFGAIGVTSLHNWPEACIAQLIMISWVQTLKHCCACRTHGAAACAHITECTGPGLSRTSSLSPKHLVRHPSLSQCVNALINVLSVATSSYEWYIRSLFIFAHLHHLTCAILSLQHSVIAPWLDLFLKLMINCDAHICPTCCRCKQ